MKNVYDWIVKEHRAFKHLLEELIATEPDNMKKRLRLLNKFVKNFMAHETAEEKTLSKEPKTRETTMVRMKFSLSSNQGRCSCLMPPANASGCTITITAR